MSDMTPRERRTRVTVTLVLVVMGLVVPSLVLDDAAQARAATVAAVVLALWLGEAMPPFVPTLVLIVATPLVLDVELRTTLSWCADPVLALFFGGFALGAAAQKHGVDAMVARVVVRASRGRILALLALACLGTALLSMWMSNIAAAAMMLAALRPILARLSSPSSSVAAAPDTSQEPVVRALLLAVAFGANFGGMATPIGSGPNAIALSRAPGTTFVEWMIIAAPLTLALLFASLALIVLVVLRGAKHVPLEFSAATQPAQDTLTPRAVGVMLVFGACVAAWLAEPVHGIAAPLVALGAASVLFVTGLLDGKDLSRMDWSTLILVAGGLALGKLFETSGLIVTASSAVPWDAMPQAARVVVLVLAAALFSALASNTATATMLIPIALTVDPSPSMAILVAIGCSLGAPFVFSTPPNAMAVGAGARSRDLLLVGLPLMIGGALFVAFTGPRFVALFF